MNQDRQADTGLDRLPREVVDWLTKPLASFLRIEAAAGAILLALTVAALVLSNSPWAHQFLTFWELPVGIRIGSLEAARSLRRAGRKFFPPHEQAGENFAKRIDSRSSDPNIHVISTHSR